MSDYQTKDAPRLSSLSALDIGQENVATYHDLIKRLVGNAPFDSIGERGVILRRPDLKKRIGGVFPEQFQGRHQKYHRHHNGERHESARFLLLMVEGGEGEIHVYRGDRQECTKIIPGIAYALDFEGNDWHGFMTADDGVVINCVALHTGDLYDSEETLSLQTDLAEKPPVKETFFSAAKGVSGDQSFFKNILNNIKTDLANGNKTGYASRAFAELFIYIREHGQKYGAPEFEDISDLKDWVMRAIEADRALMI